MENSFHGLPPSKRFKLLQQRESRVPSCLPAKKRMETHRRGDLQQQQQQLPPPATSCCLPAKKRVWAPHPVMGIDEYGSEGDEAVAREVKLWDSTEFGYGEVTVPEAEAEPPREELGAEEEQDETEKAAVAEEEDEDDDGIVCSVCQSTNAHPADPIVFCDGCDLMVHASCYGNPLIKSIPEGDWFCVRCEEGGAAQKKPPDCCLCPGKGGATKPTTDGRWAHVLCALLVPEVFFHDAEGREGLDLSRVPARRWAGACCVCDSGSGCVVDCSEPKCGLAFHVSCGLEADFCVEYMEGRGGDIVVGFCEDHTHLWKKQQTTGKFKFVPRGKKK